MPRLYTLGYAAKDAATQLITVMAIEPHMRLIDIRYRPTSRFYPVFGKSALRRRFGERYFHVGSLGNVNYRDHSLPMVLLDAKNGLSLVSFLLERYPVCLLCACAHVETCHRLVVARLLSERVSCEVVHL